MSPIANRLYRIVAVAAAGQITEGPNVQPEGVRPDDRPDRTQQKPDGEPEGEQEERTQPRAEVLGTSEPGDPALRVPPVAEPRRAAEPSSGVPPTEGFARSSGVA